MKNISVLTMAIGIAMVLVSTTGFAMAAITTTGSMSETNSLVWTISSDAIDGVLVPGERQSTTVYGDTTQAVGERPVTRSRLVLIPRVCPRASITSNRPKCSHSMELATGPGPGEQFPAKTSGLTRWGCRGALLCGPHSITPSMQGVHLTLPKDRS